MEHVQREPQWRVAELDLRYQALSELLIHVALRGFAGNKSLAFNDDRP